jgi:hypothetical protein
MKWKSALLCQSKKNSRAAVCSALLLLGYSQNLYAYPNFISYGYQSCMGCHYHPNGNGPLNDYGRVVAASAIADRLLWPSKTSDEEIAQRSSFFFGPQPVAWLRPSFSYRSLRLERNFRESTQETIAIPMDTSAALVAKFLAEDRLIFVGQVSFASDQERKVHPQSKRYYSREHYVGYRPARQFGLYAGLMDKAFGLRVVDHIAYSRILTANTQYDQTHGLLLHYLDKRFELSVQPFFGNFSYEENSRTRGISVLGEVATSKKQRLGASLQNSESRFVRTHAAAVHARIGLGEEGHSVLAELGRTYNNLKDSKDTTRSLYLFNQNHFLLRRGLFLVATVEYQRENEDKRSYQYRLAPGVQFFPMQRLEFRSDLYRTTRVNEGGKARSSWDLTMQFHLWL